MNTDLIPDDVIAACADWIMQQQGPGGYTKPEVELAAKAFYAGVFYAIGSASHDRG